MAFALLFFNIERFVGVMPIFSLNSPALIFLLAIITSIFTIIPVSYTHLNLLLPYVNRASRQHPLGAPKKVKEAK